MDATLRRDWREAENALLLVLDSLGASEQAHTSTVRLVPRQIKSPQEFADWLNPQVSSDGTWAFFTTTADTSGVRYGYAMPVTRWRPEDALTFPFVEIHTVLVAWWLTTVWRTRQLSRVALPLAESGEVIAAAA